MNVWREHMLELETQTIIRILTERAIGSAQSLALKDALASDLPKSVKLYLQCEVLRWLQDDLKNAGRISNVQFATPLVRQLTNLYTRTIAPEYIFTRGEFTGTLENAIHFVENYLCRPRWTLSQFVFEKSTRVHRTEVQTRFEYVSDYLYYGKLVHGYLQKRALQEIGIEDFRSLLARIDNQVLKQHNPAELAQLTRPIFEFLLLQQDTGRVPIPIKPLTVFFEDKQMAGIKEYLERICRLRGTEQVTIAQLADIIDDFYSKTASHVEPPLETLPTLEHQQEDVVQETVSPPEKPHEAPVLESDEESIFSSADPVNETVSSSELPPDAAILESHVEPILPLTLSTPEPLPDTPVIESNEDIHLPSTDEQKHEMTVPPMDETAPQPGTATDKRNIALSLTFSGMTETAKPAAVRSSPLDLKTMVDDGQRERFIQTIFQHDQAYFNVVIDALNGMPTWEDASLYLRMFYQTSGVDPSVPDVAEFTDLIQQRYSYPERS